jgi:hypothetical protein
VPRAHLARGIPELPDVGERAAEGEQRERGGPQRGGRRGQRRQPLHEGCEAQGREAEPEQEIRHEVAVEKGAAGQAEQREDGVVGGESQGQASRGCGERMSRTGQGERAADAGQQEHALAGMTQPRAAQPARHARHVEARRRQDLELRPGQGEEAEPASVGDAVRRQPEDAGPGDDGHVPQQVAPPGPGVCSRKDDGGRRQQGGQEQPVETREGHEGEGRGASAPTARHAAFDPEQERGAEGRHGVHRQSVLEEERRRDGEARGSDAAEAAPGGAHGPRRGGAAARLHAVGSDARDESGAQPHVEAAEKAPGQERLHGQPRHPPGQQQLDGLGLGEGEPGRRRDGPGQARVAVVVGHEAEGPGQGHGPGRRQGPQGEIPPGQGAGPRPGPG